MSTPPAPQKLCGKSYWADVNLFCDVTSAVRLGAEYHTSPRRWRECCRGTTPGAVDMAQLTEKGELPGKPVETGG